MYKIEDGLYLSGYDAVVNHPFNTDQNYTIFNCTRDLDHILGSNIINYRLAIDDYPSDEANNELIFHIPKYVRVIDTDRQSGRIVIVHCRMGVSRSATLITAYLIWKYKLSVAEAIRRVRMANPRALRNLHFLFILQSLEELQHHHQPEQ